MAMRAISRLLVSSCKFVSYYLEIFSFTWPHVIPNLKVEVVSATISGSSAMVQKIHVLELPLRESLRSIVSDDSRNGAIVFLFLRANMHLPRVVRLWLIFLASSALRFVAPLLWIRSEPARSTNRNLDLTTDLPVFLVQFNWTTQWDLLDRWLI